MLWQNRTICQLRRIHRFIRNFGVCNGAIEQLPTRQGVILNFVACDTIWSNMLIVNRLIGNFRTCDTRLS
ncbi:hypothetical protein D3C85_1082500 [compost metagenome]